MPKNINGLVLIPAFNEEGRVSTVINECKKYFQNILVVDDGSTDKTLKEIINANPKIILKHCVNCGQGTAISTGIRFFLQKTQLDYLVTLDADTQHKPKHAKAMLDYAISNNLDVVLGSRFLSKDSQLNIPIGRKIILNLAMLFERFIFGIHLTDAHNGMRVISRKACFELTNLDSSSMAHATEIPLKLKKANYIMYEFDTAIDYGVRKKNQSIFSSLNIMSDLIQKK